MDQDLLKLLPIFISCLSLFISALALGWNIYRDLILKPRLKIKFNISNLVQVGSLHTTHVLLGGTNWGPGEIIINMISYKYRPWFVLSKKEYTQGFILPDHTNRFNVPLPHKLTVAESITHIFNYRADCFLKDKITHIGFIDSYGREHWALKKDVKDVIKQYRKDFPASKSTP